MWTYDRDSLIKYSLYYDFHHLLKSSWSKIEQSELLEKYPSIFYNFLTIKLTNVSGGEINYLLLITYSVRFDRMLTRKINLLLAKTFIYSLSSPMLNRFLITCYQHLIFGKLLFSFAAYLSYNQIIEKLSVYQLFPLLGCEL